jgi:chromosome segregation ATPase
LGKTPLHYAAEKGHVDIVKALVNAGANLTIKSKKGETALDLAKTEDVSRALSKTKQSNRISSPIVFQKDEFQQVMERMVAVEQQRFELEQQLIQAKQDSERYKVHVVAHTKETQELSHDLKIAMSENARVTDTVIDLENTVRTMNDKQVVLEMQLEQSKQEIEKNTSRISELESELGNECLFNKVLNERVQEQNQILLKKDETIIILNSKLEEAKYQQMKDANRIEELSQQLLLEKKENEVLSVRQESNASAIDDLNDQVQQLLSKIRSLEATNNQQFKTIETSILKTEQLEKQMAVVKIEKESVTKEHGITKDELNRVNDQLSRFLESTEPIDIKTSLESQILEQKELVQRYEVRLAHMEYEKKQAEREQILKQQLVTKRRKQSCLRIK